jgi:hypothetical protein
MDKKNKKKTKRKLKKHINCDIKGRVLQNLSNGYIEKVCCVAFYRGESVVATNKK